MKKPSPNGSRKHGPPLKKARRQRGWILFQDESGVSEKPPIRRTWSPRGHTPILIQSFNWEKLSLCAALAYRWDGRKSRLLFQTRPGTYETQSLILFLKDLKKHFCKQKIILIWDGLPAHKSWIMKAYIDRQRKWLHVERLPGYAPDLNPVEDFWGNIKGQELANRCVDGLDELGDIVSSAVIRVKKQKNLLFSFLHHAKLFF